MNLIFLIQKNAWFFEYSHDWFRIKEDLHIRTALAVLPISVIDTYTLVEQPHIAGFACVEKRKSGHCFVNLYSSDNTHIKELQINISEDLLLNVHWETKQFNDGWICCDAKLILEDVSKMSIEAYLPRDGKTDGKALTITHTESGKTHDVWLARDNVTNILLTDSGHKGKSQYQLHCAPETIDPGADPRQLGFVITGQKATPVM